MSQWAHETKNEDKQVVSISDNVNKGKNPGWYKYVKHVKNTEGTKSMCVLINIYLSYVDSKMIKVIVRLLPVCT